MIDLVKTLEFTKKLSQEVGKILLKGQKTVQIEKYKDRQDIVTNIDLQSEELLIKNIEKKFPNHNILSEEKGIIDKNSLYTWFIDPLDGTKEYLRGLPNFNINITLETSKETLLAVVCVPKTNDIYSAVKNKGAFENKNKIKVSEENKLRNSFIYTHLPNYKMEQDKAKEAWSDLEKMSRSCYRLRSFQADIISLCWLAKGAVDGQILLTKKEKWWDVSGGILMVQEAGGKVTDLKGKPIKNRDTSQGIVASNKKIHNQLIKILHKNVNSGSLHINPSL